MKNQGFSLVHLLIIVVVVLVVGAVVYPIMSKSSEKSEKPSCLDNMKQLGVAIGMYTADNNKFYPVASLDSNLVLPNEGDIYCGHGYPGSANIGRMKNASIRAQLSPYIKNQETFFCPKDDEKVISMEWEPNKRFTSYHYRFFIGARTSDGGMKEGWSTATLANPGRIYVFNEYLPFHNGKKTADSSEDTSGLWVWTSESRFNMTFADGHVASYPASHSMAWNEDLKKYDYHWPRICDGTTWKPESKLWDIE